MMTPSMIRLISEYSKRYRAKQNRLGKCQHCGKPKPENLCLCPDCLVEMRVKTRNAYRIKHGIPLDAPVVTRRPRKVK